MMNIKCVAIDDEPLALVLIEKLILKYPMLQLVATFDDAISGIEFLHHHPVDLLLIDINMPDVTGIELVKALQYKPMIIFITAHKNFAIESYELDAVDYLLKPVQQERFDKAIHKAIEYFSYKTATQTGLDEVIFIRSEYQLIKINIDDIEYIESLEDYCKIHLLHEKPIMTLTTLKAMLEKLPSEKFKRIHRSYIVPLSKIKSIINKKVKLSSVELPVGNSYTTSLALWVKK